ncbi:hypothetical protein ABWK46_21060 [Peribacillus frigoritolerans]
MNLGKTVTIVTIFDDKHLPLLYKGRSPENIEPPGRKVRVSEAPKSTYAEADGIPAGENP